MESRGAADNVKKFRHDFLIMEPLQTRLRRPRGRSMDFLN